MTRRRRYRTNGEKEKKDRRKNEATREETMRVRI